MKLCCHKDNFEEIANYNYAIDTLVTYMRSKIAIRDWHAVADAAMDIRELEAKIEVCKALEVK